MQLMNFLQAVPREQLEPRIHSRMLPSQYCGALNWSIACKRNNLPTYCAVKSVELDVAGGWVYATKLYVGHLQMLLWTDTFTVFNCVNISEGSRKSMAFQELCPVPTFSNIHQLSALCIALKETLQKQSGKWGRGSLAMNEPL